jgi:hypothetical protein
MFDPRLASPDPTTRKGFIVTGLVGSKRELYLNNAEFHATIHLLADVMMDMVDRAAKFTEFLPLLKFPFHWEKERKIKFINDLAHEGFIDGETELKLIEEITNKR